MYITKVPYTSRSGKTYCSVLLRESYRQNGKVKNRTIASLTKCDPQEIAAIELALEHKDDLTVLASLKDTVELQEGPSVGAVWTVYQIAKRLGIQKALGTSFDGKLALWQIIARVIEQSSRLSAVRLAREHAACDILKMQRGFDENDLYDNLRWLSQHQEKIERRLLLSRRGNKKPELFFYDVTSSYLEGGHNQLAAYGYNRDKKRGKQQLVIGLLCDESGEPVSIDVFPGNTQDPQTVSSQIRKVTQRFGCHRVTFVGDRGMLKKKQIDVLSEVDFYYITAITKPQIRTLMKADIIQMEMFGEQVHEVQQKGVRYILRRNPHRAKEIATTRLQKRQSIEQLVQHENIYLKEHPRAQVSKAAERVQAKIQRLRIQSWLSVIPEPESRTLCLAVDEAILEQASLLDGCYVIKSDLPQSIADKQLIHDRYKELSEVERAFRTCKTGHLELRPVYVQTESSTRGHVLVVMLAYLVVRELSRRWCAFDVTVQEGLVQLSTLCAMEMKVDGQGACLRIPTPRKLSQELLKALEIQLPTALPHKEFPVVTRKRLTKQRKA
jgi:transposase